MFSRQNIFLSFTIFLHTVVGAVVVKIFSLKTEEKVAKLNDDNFLLFYLVFELCLREKIKMLLKKCFKKGGKKE
jgi:hypothetical protein